jgi:hypothetical protein
MFFVPVEEWSRASQQHMKQREKHILIIHIEIMYVNFTRILTSKKHQQQKPGVQKQKKP